MQQELLKGHLNEAIVLSSHIREGEDIYIWVKMQDVNEPRAYRLPWDEQTAVELHKAQQEAEAQGTAATMKMGGDEESDGSEPVFEASAPPTLPSKTEE